MKVGPTNLEELTEEQREYVLELDRQEKEEMLRYEQDEEYRAKVDAYHAATTQMLNERASGRTALTFRAPRELDEIERHFEQVAATNRNLPISGRIIPRVYVSRFRLNLKASDIFNSPAQVSKSDAIKERVSAIKAKKKKHHQ